MDILKPTSRSQTQLSMCTLKLDYAVIPGVTSFWSLLNFVCFYVTSRKFGRFRDCPNQTFCSNVSEHVDTGKGKVPRGLFVFLYYLGLFTQMKSCFSIQGTDVPSLAIHWPPIKRLFITLP